MSLTKSASVLLSLTTKLHDVGTCHRYYYLDDEKNQQGPFSRYQMRAWTEKNCFDANLQIKCGDNGVFVRLGDLASLNKQSLDTMFATSARDDVIDAINALEELQHDMMQNAKRQNETASGSTSTCKGYKGKGKEHHKRSNTWKKEFDTTHNSAYYFDTATGKSQWDRPDEF